MNTTYAIDDADGNQLTTGLDEDEALATAQNIANRMGCSVWLYETCSDDEAELEPVEVTPE